jgi:hypothetical protein
MKGHIKELKEFHRIFMIESHEGIWRAAFDKPLPTTIAVEAQAEYLFRQAYLAECNTVFARMYGCERPEEIWCSRFVDLVDVTNETNRQNILMFLKNGYRIREAESCEFDKQGKERYFLNTAVGIEFYELGFDVEVGYNAFKFQSISLGQFMYAFGFHYCF